VAATRCHIVCLQESKLSNLDQQTASYLGGFRLRSFVFKPAIGVLGTRGGIVVLWNDDSITLANCVTGEFHLSADIEVKECLTKFRLSVVYGPTMHRARQRFLEELKAIKPENNTRWLLLGDFNLIYKAADKNNRRLNRRLMRQFQEVLNECELQEIHLQNRKFTWSNERRHPTLMKLDRVFRNAEWDSTFTSHVLHALSTSLSDHAPLLLSNQSGPRRPRTFRFENF
jgi:hypothetical protein